MCGTPYGSREHQSYWLRHVTAMLLCPFLTRVRLIDLIRHLRSAEGKCTVDCKSSETSRRYRNSGDIEFMSSTFDTSTM